MSTLTNSLQGKIALITGSSRSIGAAIAKHMGEQGVKVIVNYINDVKAAEEVVAAITASGSSAVAIKADVSSVAGGQYLVDETIKAFGGLDILVLNAAIMGSKVLADVDEVFYDAHFATNVKGPLFLAKAAVPHLPTPGGRIIFFSSSTTAATIAPPTALVYAASKGAVEQLSRILAKDLAIGGKGITVNTISPGPIDTPLFRAGKPQGMIDMISRLAPSGRLGEVEDVAPVVSFVASPAAQWVSGQNIRVNGLRDELALVAARY